jgi:ABC-2 type transport system ATP-binding protein
MRLKPLIEVENLEMKRGTFTLSIPAWQVNPGEVIGIVGPNGAGKTTFLEALAGLRPVTRGSLQVFGKYPWKQQAEVRSNLGFMTDTMPLFAMRIDRFLDLISGYYSTWDIEFVQTLLDRFKLDPGSKIHSLSRGQGTRIRLVAALAFKPRILVLDEPASGLDLAGRRALLETVLDVVRDPERSVIISSHMLSDLERIADRLLVIEAGRVVREGGTNQLIGDGRTLEEALLEWGAAG